MIVRDFMLLEHNQFNNYPLKFYRAVTDYTNYCYANVIAQALIHLGTEFVDKLNVACIDGIHQISIRNTMNQYINEMRSSSLTSSTIALRLIASNFAFKDNQYNNNSQQDAFLFFLDIYNKFPNSIQNLFQFIKTDVYACEFGHTTTNRNIVHHIIISSQKQTACLNFNDMFVQLTLTKFCHQCQQWSKHSHKSWYTPLENNQYAIICINMFHIDSKYNLVRNKSQITNFNSELVSLLSSTQEVASYKVITAVLRIGETSLQGHYICWCRAFNGL